ncbi:MAG: large, multifunctional secreted protein [Fibrobacteres bacterium]|nr:large, multifunctional secreted protein [Fibrobacterota bacterium]
MTIHSCKSVFANLAFAASMAAAGIPDAMHPDFDMKEVPLADKYKAMGMGFLSDGRMVLATTEVIGGGEVPPASAANKLYVISNMGGATAADIKMKEVANNWKQMVGVTIVDDKIYVSDRDGFYKIVDIESNTLDLANNRQKIASWPDENKWKNGFSWHQFVFTPIFLNGSFYAPYSGSIRPGGPSDAPASTAFSGAFLKWDLTGKLEKFAGGLRSPNGANVAPNGDMFVADNQGAWLPSSTFMHMKQGMFYGHRQSPTRDTAGNITVNNAPNWAEGLPYERPTAWLDHGTLRASPSQPIYMTKGRYVGDWLLGDVNNPGLVRIALDDVQGTYNGAVFWFAKGMGISAINRMAWGTDGSLYVGTIMKIAGNWPAGDKAPLYRVTPKTTATTFDMRAVRHLADGVEIIFTDPVDPASIAGANFSVTQWHYTRQEGYGLGKGSSEPRTVSATELSADGRRVHLKIAGLKDDYVTYFKLTNVKAATGGAAVWNNECWFTLNKLSTRTWDATVSIADEAPKSVKLESLVRQRVSGAGLEVSVAGEGNHAFSLITLNGARIRSASSVGQGTVVLPTAGLAKGLYLLEVRQGAQTLVRPVSLSW